MNEDSDSLMVSIEVAARMLNVSERTIRRMLAEGYLEGWRNPARPRIRKVFRQSLAAVVEQGREGGNVAEAD